MDLGLSGRTVIITGGSGGIGRAVARGFAAEGARVLITYPYALDDAEAAESLVAAALDWTGRADVLVNNALMFGGPVPDDFENVSEDEWIKVVRGNSEGAIRLARLVARVMRKQRWGRMVHVSSSLFYEGKEGFEYYMATKGALHGFSRSVVFGLGRDGDILSNVVMPGYVRTERNQHWDIFPVLSEEYAQRTPIKRVLDATEIASSIVYLCSAANTGINGQAIAVTGGA
jgi:3-oxoacyl-[acyl-carrier protein] reductase